jgi:hypothetical protein
MLQVGLPNHSNAVVRISASARARLGIARASASRVIADLKERLLFKRATLLSDSLQGRAALRPLLICAEYERQLGVRCPLYSSPMTAMRWRSATELSQDGLERRRGAKPWPDGQEPDNEILAGREWFPNRLKAPRHSLFALPDQFYFLPNRGRPSGSMEYGEHVLRVLQILSAR